LSYLHDLAGRLVAEDTVSERSAVAALELLADHLAGFGFEVSLPRYERGDLVQANLVAVAGPPAADGLLVSGHVDVVPFADQPGWTRAPLRLAIEEERVFGRGTSDMKVFLAHCLDAARRLAPRSLERPLAFLFTAEEEIGCLGAGRVAPQLAGLLGGRPLPRLAWIGEPTSHRVFHAHKGIVAFGVEVCGRGGHSSVPEAGVNAIAVAARAIGAIGEIQAELRARPSARAAALFPDAPYTSLNFGTIRGGTAANVIAESCAFGVSYRPLPDEDPLALHARIREHLEALDARDWGSPERRAEIRVGEARLAPGLLSRRGTPLEAALCEHFGGEAGGGAPYCTDGGQLAGLGIDVLVCGPGELAQAHQPDESISRAAFERGGDDVLAVALRMCGGRTRA
jgi:acetylornithine deacetylase